MASGDACTHAAMDAPAAPPTNHYVPARAWGGDLLQNAGASWEDSMRVQRPKGAARCAPVACNTSPRARRVVDASRVVERMRPCGSDKGGFLHKSRSPRIVVELSRREAPWRLSQNEAEQGFRGGCTPKHPHGGTGDARAHGACPRAVAVARGVRQPRRGGGVMPEAAWAR